MTNGELYKKLCEIYGVKELNAEQINRVIQLIDKALERKKQKI